MNVKLKAVRISYLANKKKF